MIEWEVASLTSKSWSERLCFSTLEKAQQEYSKRVEDKQYSAVFLEAKTCDWQGGYRWVMYQKVKAYHRGQE